MQRLPKEPIHKSIKKRLGYEIDQSDDEVYQDWKDRLRRVCKPCWELRYCPYGPLVEHSPILPGRRVDQTEHVEYLKECLKTGLVGSVETLTDDLRAKYRVWLKDEQVLLNQVIYDRRQSERYAVIEQIDDPDERRTALLANQLPPIQEYRVKFDDSDRNDFVEKDFSAKTWIEIQKAVSARKTELQAALKSGNFDHRHPIEPARREMFEAMVHGFESDELPENIPSTFYDGECSIFGHICPVFFAAEIVTESELERRIGRGHLKFETMMRIVRRDDYRCQHCKTKLRDDEVEFDHIIPISKGGSSDEHNMRLTCFNCNRDKSDSFTP